MSAIEEKVKAIIVDKLGVDETEVKPEASFTNDLGADSLLSLLWNSKRNSISLFQTIKQKKFQL